MLTRTRFLIGFVVLVLAIIFGALMIEQLSGPTFRPEAHASYADCIRNIPVEWGPGSIERMRAEASCEYLHAATR